eukprot:11627572-Alexandrium_andersonii.AAC.1
MSPCRCSLVLSCRDAALLGMGTPRSITVSQPLSPSWSAGRRIATVRIALQQVGSTMFRWREKSWVRALTALLVSQQSSQPSARCSFRQ